MFFVFHDYFQIDDDDDDEDEEDDDDEPLNVRHKGRNTDGSNNKNSDLLLEPKSEYEDGNDEPVEDLTMADDEILDDLDQAGPSHGGEGSSQGKQNCRNHIFSAANCREKKTRKMTSNLIVGNFVLCLVQVMLNGKRIDLRMMFIWHKILLRIAMLKVSQDIQNMFSFFDINKELAMANSAANPKL